MYYPDNTEESMIVENRLKNIKRSELHMFHKSDGANFINMFAKLVNENPKKLDNFLSRTIDPHILKIKNSVGRKRPFRFNEFIKKNRIKSTSVFTPSFPSGHTMQTLFLSKNLAKLYPDKKDKLLELAELIGQSRISAGHHYPSDHEYGKWLVNNVYYTILPKLSR